MIQIKRDKLDDFALEHYEKLAPKLAKNFPNSCEYDLKTVLTAKPKKLKEIAEWFRTLSKLEQERFDYFKSHYKLFTEKTSPYNAYILTEKLEVNTCPYCNKNYTHTITTKSLNARDGQISRPTIDHFYTKSKYPILALSFYNLIPSCHTCNSTFKGESDFLEREHVNPYLESFNEKATFNLKIANCKFYYSTEGFEIELKPNKTPDIATQNTIDTFRLNDVYKDHKDIALEIIQKAEMYNDSYIDELLKNYEGTLFKNREDLLRQLFGGYIADDDIGKRPLSKLTKDILEQLEII